MMSSGPKSPSAGEGAGEQTVYFHCGENQEIFEDCELFDEEAEQAYAAQDLEGAPELSYHAPRPLDALKVFFGWQSKNDELDVKPVDEAERRGKREGLAQTYEDSVGEFATPDDESMTLEGSGFFEKRSPYWVEGWRPRSYVLKDSRLMYFNAQRPDRPMGTLDFKLVQFEVHCCWSMAEEAKGQMCRTCDVCDDSAPEDFYSVFLKPKQYPNKIFAFRGPSKEIRHLANKLATLAKTAWLPWSPRGENPTVSVKNFWRYPFVRETDFLQRAESGDILLFRGKDRRSAFTRTVSGFAIYDHVALVLRTRGSRVVILEATGSDGVNVVPWSSFKEWGWHACYDRLAYRKVFFVRTADKLNRLEGFVKSQLGVRYSLTLNKIFKRKLSREFDAQGSEISCPNQTDDDDMLPGEDSNFFCSELVAACLKRCGVLAGARASAQYWPGSFSQWSPNPLPLHEDIYIGAEEKIIYSDEWG
mmetsp:Transcript_137907/g.239755  ORF Transcript_137907/g.239755 Transcript_137907/m.239755 type:complete len:474 (-) Transcript_137907:75-1496(-)